VSRNISVRHEAKRGCGYRKPGGLYLVNDGIGEPCSALPFPLGVCPCCSAGVKPTRGWTWITPDLLLAGKLVPHGTPEHSDRCPFSEPGRLGERAGLLWIGETYYSTPQDFTREAARMGVSRRIHAIPNDFEIGQWVLLAHRKAVPSAVCDCGVESDPAGMTNGETHDPGCSMFGTPGIFHAFQPSRIEYVVKGDETEEQLDRLEKRGVTLVEVHPIKEQEELSI